jgi:hypothetical protein
MKALLWAVAVLALEVLLLWGYFAVIGMGRMACANVAVALLVGTASVLMWLGFRSGFGQTLKRLLVAVLGCIILSYGALVVLAVVDLPTALRRRGLTPEKRYTAASEATAKGRARTG